MTMKTTMMQRLSVIVNSTNNTSLLCNSRRFRRFPRYNRYCWYHTNGDNVKRDDPYHILGLSYSDGATTTEIREAFKKRAKELHPDLNTTLSPDEAHQQFQRLVRSYEALTKFSNNNAEDSETVENWRRTIWRQSDQIALDRTDVAGLARKRPAPPALSSAKGGSSKKSWENYNMIGHPQGLGGRHRRGGRRDEYLGDGTSVETKRRKNPSSVGRGQSKWVTPRHYKNNSSSSSSSTSVGGAGEDGKNDNESDSGSGGYKEWDGTTIAMKASDVTTAKTTTTTTR